MNERVKELRKALGLSGEEFGNRLGVKRSAVSDIERGRNKLTEQMIKSICREFKVNEEWLRYGTGEMFMVMDVQDQLMDWAGEVLGARDGEFKKRFITMLMDLSEDQWKFIEKKAKELANKNEDSKSYVKEIMYPYIIGGASAGLTSFLTDIEIESIKAPICDNADFIISVSGDSMEPTYYDGEKVYVQKTPELNFGDIGIFSRGNELLIKEYGEDGLISHNPKYKMIKGTEDIQTVGKVIEKVEL